MNIRCDIGQVLGRACEWGLKHIFKRKASTLPGRVVLAVDPKAIAHMAPKITSGSVVVVGTNGKTTTTNLIAHTLEESGQKVFCNWAGANMASGVAAALLPKGRKNWGIFENDELSTIHVVPALKPRALVLLNLFRDQLDRCGEIDHVQDTIVEALFSSPETVFIYDADDPLCQGIAWRLKKTGQTCLSFGIRDDLHQLQDRVLGGGFCQACAAPLRYEYRHYGQLGNYSCTACNFGRGELDYSACNVSVGPEGVAFDVVDANGALCTRIRANWGGIYMVYNLLAAYVAAHFCHADDQAFSRAVSAYDPKNGRLQHFDIAHRHVVLNLAKNPTGFNQNLRLLMQDLSPKIVYIIINDDYNDGKDVSWLWDVDFELLATLDDPVIYVGGHRANDMQVRLKYAGISAEIVESVPEVLQLSADLEEQRCLWVLTNYSALWPAKAALDKLEGEGRK